MILMALHSKTSTRAKYTSQELHIGDARNLTSIFAQLLFKRNALANCQDSPGDSTFYRCVEDCFHVCSFSHSSNDKLHLPKFPVLHMVKE